MEIDIDFSVQSAEQHNVAPSAFASLAASENSLASSDPRKNKDGEPTELGMARSSSLFLPTVQRPGIKVYSFGRGDCGQQGSGVVTPDGPSAMTVIEGLGGKDVISVAAGAFHSAAVTADGELYTWGANDEGQCGIRMAGTCHTISETACAETNFLLPRPTRVETLENFKVGTVACGDAHTVVLLDDGNVLTVGRGEYGQLGVGTPPAERSDRNLAGITSSAPPTKQETFKPVRTLRDAGTTVIRVATGGNHTVLLDTTGMVYTTGDGSFGALGIGSHGGDEKATDGDCMASTTYPIPLPRLWPLGIAFIAAGEAHTAALSADGLSLFTWGRGGSGALGHGSFESTSLPTLVRIPREDSPLCSVSCGNDHTVVLTQNEGACYAWGQGTWGATGLGHRTATCLPQPVTGLEGKRIVQISAGARHTLFLASDNSVWATGSNEYGQCGEICEEENCSTQTMTDEIVANHKVITRPKAVRLLVAGEYLSNHKEETILFVTAGGDHSMVVVQSSQHIGHGGDSQSTLKEASLASGPLRTRAHGERWLSASPPLLTEVLQRVLVPNEQLMVDKEQNSPVTEGHSAARKSALISCIERTFANPAFLIAAFSTRHNTLDLELISSTYQSLLTLYDQEVVTVLGGACIRYLDALEKYVTTVFITSFAQKSKPLDQALSPELDWIPPTLFIILQNPLAGDPTTFGSHLIMRIGRIIAMSLPAHQRIPVRRALQKLLGLLPAETFAARCVRPVQRYLSHLVERGRLGAGRLEAMMAGVLLDVLRQSNEDCGGKIPYSEFYNKELSKEADWQAEYVAWVGHKQRAAHALVSFCQMPFLITPETKSRILHGEAMYEKHQHMSAAAMQAFFHGGNPEEAGFLKLNIRRTHVVEDALNGLGMSSEDDLKKPLRITFFSGGVAEPAQDEGGVKKEFFQLLVRDLFRQEFGMFTYDESTRTHWFNETSFETEGEYGMVGALVGLAIYNAVLLDAHFPLVLYKKLLGGTPTFGDLKQAFPELGRGLQALLDYEPASEVEAVFCRNFEVEIDCYGELQTRDLKPGGRKVAVTGANRQEYVDLYTKWVLIDSISTQFAAFARGFWRVCGGPALTMFTAVELELLVCGLPHLDFDGLQQAARYEGGYDAHHPSIRWFWDILHSWSLEQKRQFLMFTTGSDRAPVGGLGSLSICVQRGGPDTDRLPTSHTCFNTLLLPEYATKEKMQERLLTAVMNAQGFGLQ